MRHVGVGQTVDGYVGFVTRHRPHSFAPRTSGVAAVIEPGRRADNSTARAGSPSDAPPNHRPRHQRRLVKVLTLLVAATGLALGACGSDRKPNPTTPATTI